MTESELDYKKILILIPPYYGHLNPVCCMANELIKTGRIKITFYGIEKCREMIEKTGSNYREYKYFPTEVNQNFSLLDVYKGVLDVTYINMDHLIEICSIEKPDLIICDNISYHAKYLHYYLDREDKLEKLNYKLPKLLTVYQSFAFMFGIYPNEKELKLFKSGSSYFNQFKDILSIIYKNRRIKNKYNLDLPLLFRQVIRKFDQTEIERICFVLEDLQPRSEQLKKKITFVGCCIEEQIRNSMEAIINQKLKMFLDLFEPVNPNYDKKNSNKENLKLIYVSFGTVINYVFHLFEIIIEALKSIETFESLRIIISTGDDCFKKYEHMVAHEGYILPDNIAILAKVPQIEVLKRADLFITHAGMNSVNESIHFGVPVVCLPISTDQPFVAVRVCDELNLGIRLDYKTVSKNQMKDSILKMLNETSYLDRMRDFSIKSRKSNGVKESVKLVENYLKKTEIRISRGENSNNNLINLIKSNNKYFISLLISIVASVYFYKSTH